MSLKAVLEKINKKYPGSVKLLSECESVLQVKKCRTGIAALDLALRGGVPLGRITEIFGVDGSTKTTAALHIVKNYLSCPVYKSVPKANVYCVWVDLERSLTPAYAKKIGVSLDRVILIQPTGGEMAFDAQYLALMGNEDDYVLWVTDTIAELAPEKEESETLDEYNLMAGQARLISSGLRRKVLPILRKSWLSDKPRATILHLNQARDKMSAVSFGGVDSPGGRHRRHANSLLVEFRATGSIDKRIQRNNEKGMLTFGLEVRFRVLKNKCGGPAPTEAFSRYWMYTHRDKSGRKHIGGTFDNEGAVLSAALFHGAVSLEKQSYVFKGKAFARGRDAAEAALAEDLSLQESIFQSTLDIMRREDLATEEVHGVIDDAGGSESAGADDEERPVEQLPAKPSAGGRRFLLPVR